MIPRFVTDQQLREHFGISDRALQRLRLLRDFPRRDPLIGKTDRRAVDVFFDWRAGLSSGDFAVDGDEDFSE